MDSAAPSAILVRDSQGCIPLSRVVSEGDSVVLLTPVVVPLEQSNAAGTASPQDPFEVFAQALLKQAPKPRLHHVPYTVKGGIGHLHLEIIQRENAKLLIFFVSGPPQPPQPSQVGMAKRLRDGIGNRPLLIVACCNVRELEGLEASFPTIIQLAGYSPATLEAAVGLLYRPINLHNLVLAPQAWTVEDFVFQRHMGQVHELWCQSVSKEYQLPLFKLQMLLTRDGYAKHYVVREPETSRLVGFCATYTTWADGGGDRLVGSLAMIMVKSEYRRRGIGLSLHDYALRNLKRTRGVFRLQLGSTFPRLLFGLPLGSPFEGWFRRRGWELGLAQPGKGQEVCDWLLRFNNYPERFMSSAGGLKFRPCEPQEFHMALELVSIESARNDNMGWCDQYQPILHTEFVKDVIVGVAGDTVVATALTYVPNTESPVNRDLPWASSIGLDIGGVTCICISDDIPAIGTSRDLVMLRLLDACVRSLQEQGMQGMLLDAVRGGEEGFQVMGFHKWARYKDSWRPASAT